MRPGHAYTGFYYGLVLYHIPADYLQLGHTPSSNPIDRDSEVLILGPEKVVNQVFYRTI